MLRKLFWLFGGLTYYPAGGMADFLTSADTAEELLEILEDKDRVVKKDPDDIWHTRSNDLDWWHILDSTTMTITHYSGKQEYGVSDADDFSIPVDENASYVLKRQIAEQEAEDQRRKDEME